jgi:phosphoribosylformylglycinamidine synthase
MQPRVLILHAPGTNRDREAALACQLAGGVPEIVAVDRVVAGDRKLADYQMLLLPGGFSFGDDLGAGKLWSIALRDGLGDQLQAFVAAGRPVMGICNGFQAPVKAGLLPGDMSADPVQRVTLTRNDSARFECRWVTLRPEPDSPCVFTRGLTDDLLIQCPVAHGEGKIAARDDTVRDAMGTHRLAALRYVSPDGSAATYPFNPNGSEGDIAGLTNPAGNVLGLMPHPEDHIVARQHPRFHRGERGGLGLVLFEAGIKYAAEAA